MLKKYEVSRTLAADDMVNISVLYPDAGTEGSMVITRQDGEIFEISDEGGANIGLARELGGTTCLTSIIFNLDPGQERLRMNIFLNGHMIVEHASAKSQDEHPTVKVELAISV